MHYYNILRPLLFLLPEETAHSIAFWALRHNLLPYHLPHYSNEEMLFCKIWEMDFPHPVGLAAGFDKNGMAIKQLFDQGFSFIETGTVTLKPQEGNPKPRMFRLKEDHAIINRMGFNNVGVDIYIKELDAHEHDGNIGVNIGVNKDTKDPIADFVSLLDKLYSHADYMVLNLSSPNTPGLRDLQKKEALDELLTAFMQEKKLLDEDHPRHTPLFVKLSPDLNDNECEDIANICQKHAIDGLIISNSTTGHREHLISRKNTREEGGLSGDPLFQASTELVKKMFILTNGNIPIIGVGGISHGDEAYAKIRAGASLVQIYTALIYHGFHVIGDINRRLIELMHRDGLSNISQAVGLDAKNG